MTGPTPTLSPRSIGGGGLTQRSILTATPNGNVTTPPPRRPRKRPDWGTIAFIVLLFVALLVCAYKFSG